MRNIRLYAIGLRKYQSSVRVPHDAVSGKALTRPVEDHDKDHLDPNLPL